MIKNFILKPKDELGRNEFEKTVYLEAEAEELFLGNTTDKAKELISTNPEEWADTVAAEILVTSDSLGSEEQRNYEELKIEIMNDLKKLELDKTESLEEAIRLIHSILKERFEKAGLYPLGDSDWIASIGRDALIELGWEARVMRSMSVGPIHHFIEVIDRSTNLSLIFDPMPHLVQPFSEFSKQFEKFIEI